MNDISKKYRKLDDIEHVLLRPGMYVGSMTSRQEKKWVVDDGVMIQKDVNYNPAFLKIFDEIIMNSVDEFKRNGSSLNTIKVMIDRDTNAISVFDNGGIPVVKHSIHKQWIPELIFSNLKAGSNFDDSDKREGAGLNGVGSTICNIFSKSFTIKTADKKNCFEQSFIDNMHKHNTAKVKASKKGYTEITYIADFERFGMTSIDDDSFLLIQKRVYDIAACNPKLKVYFNGELIKINSFEDYIKLYIQKDYIYECKKDMSWSVGVSSSDSGFTQISFVNSTETYDGGTHLDYITNQIISKLRDYFLKKHKIDIKPSEIKNHIAIFLNATVINPSFSSQTKEKLITEQKDFGYEFELSAKFINAILKSDIIDNIKDWIEQKKIADDSKLQRELNKKISKIKIEKLIDAKSRNRSACILSIYEGNSASTSFRKYRNPQTMGAFLIRGKFINVSEITTSKLIQNEEAVNLMASLGLKLGQKVDKRTLRYGKIYISADADVDGDAITALLVNFFYRYWPELFDMKMIYRVITPIVVAEPNKKSKGEKLFFYEQDDYDKWCKKANLKNFTIKYKKGLAALTDDEYNDMVNKPELMPITSDQASKISLDIWFGKNTEKRKEKLLK